MREMSDTAKEYAKTHNRICPVCGARLEVKPTKLKGFYDMICPNGDYAEKPQYNGRKND